MEGALFRFNFASHSGICEQYLSAHKRDRDAKEARGNGRTLAGEEEVSVSERRR